MHMALKRLREALTARATGKKTTVFKKDLDMLLYHFDRLDADARARHNERDAFIKPPIINETIDTLRKSECTVDSPFLYALVMNIRRVESTTDLVRLLTDTLIKIEKQRMDLMKETTKFKLLSPSSQSHQ
jgi:hypothetical protein